MTRLILATLGPFEVTLDRELVTDFKSTRVRALLAYLAVEADRPHSREALAGLLWPDWPDREALNNLRYALSDLRRAIRDRDADPPFLLITRETLQFNSAGDSSVDIATLADLSEPAPGPGVEDLAGLERAVALYRGDFLEGLSLGDSPAFEEWTLLVRERLGRQLGSALYRLSAGYEGRGDYEQAQAWGWRQLEREPWDEAAHRQVMRALALGGQRSAAVAQYESCRRTLAEELGVEPAPETQRLCEAIRNGEIKAPTPVHHPPDRTFRPPAFLHAERDRLDSPVFVAREGELATLDGFLDSALAGQGRIVLITGEAGSGKTALITEFTGQAQERHTDLIVAGGHCNAHVGIGDPYLPFREILALLTGDVEARWAAGTMTGEHARRLWKLLPLTVKALLDTGPDLVGTFVQGGTLADRVLACGAGQASWSAELEELAAGRASYLRAPVPLQSDLFRQYAAVLKTVARHAPLALVVDDLQWADAGAISLLFYLGRQLAGSRILMVGAYRPEEVAIGRHDPSSPSRSSERHPLEPVVNELRREFGDIILNVDRAEGRDLIDALLDSEPNRLGPSFRAMLHRQTRGHPLFTVELLRGMQERGDLVRDDEGRWSEGAALDWETLPARMEAAIAERIERLEQPLQTALRVASVEGEEFTAEVVARVVGADEREMALRFSSELDRRHRLVRAHAIERLGPRRVSRYRFRHFLTQKYLYDSLDQVERAYLHEDVGTALEALGGGEGGEVAVRLARHFQEAGIADKAIRYLHQAGDRASQLSAYEEGVGHLTKALTLLGSLPDSPERAQQELGLQISLAVALVDVVRPERARVLARARQLGLEAGDRRQLCRVLGELSVLCYVRGEQASAQELAEEALQLAESVRDPLLVALGHWYLGFVCFSRGKFITAKAHLDAIVDFYDPEEHHQQFIGTRGSDAGVSALAYQSCNLWLLGYPDQARRLSEYSLSLAYRLDHAFSLADVLCFAGCWFNILHGDAPAIQRYAEELGRLSSESLWLNWEGAASYHRGQANIIMGHFEQGMAEIRAGIENMHEQGMKLGIAATLGLLAEAQAKAGGPAEGLSTLDDAFALVEETDERFWEAELWRVRAELTLMDGDEAGAEASLGTALEIARRQGARAWELRAATTLGRLWASRGKREEARRLLTDVYAWFTEGWDTPDLQAARALLDELSSSGPVDPG